MTNWLQITFKVNSKNVDKVSDSLTDLDALAITLDDIDNDPLSIIALFSEDTKSQPIIDQLGSYLESYIVEIIPEQNWQQQAIADLEPMQFGEKLWVCPSWTTPPDPDAINIILDPGMAFGTGSHQTTSLCLEWLKDHVNQNHIVIDYGCGSGILAIAAAKLGAKKVYAIDIDPDAIEVTKANASNNNFSIETFLPDKFPTIQADILIANILANPLIELVNTLKNLVKPNGKIALSGILDNQIEAVIKAYETWFSIEKIITKDEWALISATKNKLSTCTSS